MTGEELIASKRVCGGIGQVWGMRPAHVLIYPENQGMHQVEADPGACS